jgi:predicted ATPase
LIEFSTEHGFTLWLATGTVWRGLVLVEQGLTAGSDAGQKQVTEGMAQIHKGLAIYRATGTRLQLPLILSSMAGVLGKMGQVEEALALLDEAFTVVAETDERYWEAELYRLKGELLLVRNKNETVEAESCFQHAIGVCRRQKAKSLELRAVMSLCRLWQAQGKTVEAQQMLAEVYAWFTGGFDTGDLQDAKALLEELSVNELIFTEKL